MATRRDVLMLGGAWALAAWAVPARAPAERERFEGLVGARVTVRSVAGARVRAVVEAVEVSSLCTVADNFTVRPGGPELGEGTYEDRHPGLGARSLWLQPSAGGSVAHFCLLR